MKNLKKSAMELTGKI